jgi:hypothetical protein
MTLFARCRSSRDQLPRRLPLFYHKRVVDACKLIKDCMHERRVIIIECAYDFDPRKQMRRLVCEGGILVTIEKGR